MEHIENSFVDFDWNATEFFRMLTEKNRLARKHGFDFCSVSGLEGFHEAVARMQARRPFVAVSDCADGYTDTNNSPHTRRMKTVFFSMPHKEGDMKAREDKLRIMRELFRQFMSWFLREKVTLEEKRLYVDSRIRFTEINRYFFNGAACAFFEIATDVYTDLRYNEHEWEQ